MAGYGDDAGFAAWLLAEGYVLPGGGPTPAVLRQRGSSYIDGLYGIRFPGKPTGGYAQERAWPRTGATAYGAAIPDDEIPVPVVNASYYAAYREGTKAGSLAATAQGSKKVASEKVDVIEMKYFESKGDDLYANTPRFSYIEGLLAPFITTGVGRYGAILVV